MPEAEPRTGSAGVQREPRSLALRAPLLILTTAGILVAIFAQLGHDGPQAGVTHAGIFSRTETVDLKTNGQDSVVGVFGGEIAPGDVRGGVVQLSHTTTAVQQPFDLDIDVTYSVYRQQGGHAPTDVNHDFPHRLTFATMRYGSDDLLRAPGRNLIAEIDANPIVGNGDGRLSLAEFRAGVNDLPAPGTPRTPTPFNIALQLDPQADNSFMWMAASMTFTFYMSAPEESDLN